MIVFHVKYAFYQYHFIQSLLEDGELMLEKIQGSKNPADMLTNMVAMDKLTLCATSIDLRS